MNARAFVILVVALAFGFTITACGGSSSKPTVEPTSVVWPAPSDPMALARKAGLQPETAERLQYHVHSHLDVFVDGQRVVVPAGIGIDITNPGVHTFTENGEKSYGGISKACDAPCISPLHTHDVTGVLHTESATRKNNTLGQLFVEWDQRLDANCVSTYCKPAKTIVVYVDGKRFDANPATIPLTNRKEIAIVIGNPPAEVPTTGDFGQS